MNIYIYMYELSDIVASVFFICEMSNIVTCVFWIC